MQISLLAVITILCFTRCQSQETAENSASEIIGKFRDLLYDETTMSPDYEDSTDIVTSPSTTPSSSTSSSPVTTTEASSESESEGDNLSEADLEVNNLVQSALEPRQLELSPDYLDYEAESEAKANSVTFPEVETIQSISNPLPDLSAAVPDPFVALPDNTETVTNNKDEVSPESDNISDSEPVHAAAGSPGKWFYYIGQPGLVAHWPSTETDQTNEVEDRLMFPAHTMAFPYYFPYPHPRHYGHHPYVYSLVHPGSAGHV